MRAAVQADQEDPRCAEIRAQFQESFKEIFFQHTPIKEVPRDLRPHGEHAIPFKTATPQPQKCVSYRTCGIRDAAFRLVVNKVIARGFLQKSDSVWGARAFVVPEPGRKWRLVIDYRHLNSEVSDDPFLLPVIEDMILSQVKNALWSVFDLDEWFHKMHLAPEIRQYTAILTPWGLYKWLVLPMGLKTAPTAYQRMVAACLDTGFGDKKSFTKGFGTKPYIDDLLHGTPDWDILERNEKLSRLCIENHERQLRQLFGILAHYKLSLKPEKCKKFVTRVKFCGHILTPGGRHRDSERVAAIGRWQWEDITTLTHLKGFLRFTQWYSVYLHDYARMAAPLQMALQGMCLTKAQKKAQKYQRQTDLLPGTGTRQRANFSRMSQGELVQHDKLQGKIYWTPEMKEAFEELKQRFQFPDLIEDWLITVESSTFAFGGTLEQKDAKGNLRPVMFFSKKLQGTGTKRPDRSYHKTGQLNWHILDQEMYGIVATLYKFRSWLQTGVKIKCRTNHKGLESWVKEHFDRMGGPVGRRSRWHQFLARFPLEVVYIKGENNRAADVLSRWAYPAYLANPDTNMHGRDYGQAGWDASEQEGAHWVDAALARLAPTVDPEPHRTPLPPRTWNTPERERLKHLDLSTNQVRVHWVEVNCTLPSTGQSLAGAVHQWHAALRPVSHSDGALEFCKDRELTEQAERARRQQAFINALPTGPRRATVRQLAHSMSGDVVSVRHDWCKYARNAPDAQGLHWRSKRRQARAYMGAQYWYQGAAALMHHTLPTGCWDGPNTAMLRTLTAYYENAHPQSEPPTHVQCYQAMQAWCRAGRKKKADMPDKGTVMMPLPTEFLFHNWAPHYEADPALKGEYAAARTGVAEHRRAHRHVNGRGQLLEHHYVIVPKAVASKVKQVVHSCSHPGVDKTLELLHRRYKFHGYTTTSGCGSSWRM